jgi:hypothetical protein
MMALGRPRHQRPPPPGSTDLNPPSHPTNQEPGEPATQRRGPPSPKHPRHHNKPTRPDIGAVDPLELDSLVQTTLRAFVPLFGPLEMTDLIGHDTLRDISNALYPELATDATASRTIEQHVAHGRLGVKRGRGFYDDNDRRVADLTNRLYRIARQLAAEST